MKVYFITIFIVVVFAILAKKTGKDQELNNEKYVKPHTFFVLLITTSLTIVSGLRWKVGTDYGQYALNYRSYVDNVLESLFTYSEPGINIIAWTSSVLYDDYITMFFIASVITIILFVSTISKYSKMFVFSMLIFIFIGAWHGSFNGIRQYLAAAVIFAGHRYILNKRFFKYLLTLIIASLFHISSISMILLYFIPLKKLRFKNIIYLSILTLIFIYSYGFIFEFIESYKQQTLVSTSYAQNEVSLLRVLVAFAPLFLYFTVTERSKLNRVDFFYINLLLVNAVVVLATSQSAYLARFALYTNAFTALALPRLINISDKHLKFLVQMIVVILYAVFWYTDISKSGSLVNFRWIFERGF